MSDEPEPARFMVLGPVRVRTPGGPELAVGPPKQRALLAALALAPGAALSMARLVDALWGPDVPASAVSTVRTYAWRVRRLLADAGLGDDVLASAGDGYRLAVAAETVDASRAMARSTSANRALEEGRPAVAKEILAGALALWTGEPLAGVPGPFAERSRDRLSELKILLTEQYFEAELRLGHYQEAVPWLTELTAEHPQREHPYALLMRGLYGMGRQVDALRVYHEARRLLIEAHGVEPGDELAELHERILRGDADVAPPVQRPELTVRPGPVPPDRPDVWTPVPAHLPPDLPDFTGRAAQIRELEAALTAADRTAPAVVAVTGMAGVGKSSLAVHLAHRVRGHYPDGQLYVDLGVPEGGGAPMDGAALLGVLLAGLGVPADRMPGDPVERRGLWRSLLDGRRVLVLLDNAASAAQIRDALPGAPGCAVLVTGRARLDGLPLYAQLVLDVFAPEEALDLLRTGIGGDRVAAERRAAASLVRTCGALPLAIRVIVARLAARPRWTLKAMAERLADERRRMAELRTGSLAVEAAFELGHRRLTDRQARDFVLLAAVADADFSLPEAAAVLGTGPADAERRLDDLIDAAVLEAPAPGWFRYHELLRSFARTRERNPCEEAAALRRLLRLPPDLACTS